jgi:ribosomal protein L11 methyltransferase
VSVAATSENARVNGVSIASHLWDLREDPIPQAPTVLANLLRPLLLVLAKRIDYVPEMLIASGLFEQEADEIAVSFDGMVETDRRVLDGWAAVQLRRN